MFTVLTVLFTCLGHTLRMCVHVHVHMDVMCVHVCTDACMCMHVHTEIYVCM